MRMTEKTLFIFTCLFQWQFSNGLFSVKIPRSSYTVQIGKTVDLECNFPVNHTLRIEELKITWHHSTHPETNQKEVYVFFNGEEKLSNQHISYKGRATLLKNKLYTGQAVLQIASVKLSDRGTYRCLIGYGGADYKDIALVVEAPYWKINKTIKAIQTDSGHEGREVTCQSDGYPKADVVWKSDGEDISEKAKTSYTVSSDQLHSVTSVLQIKGRGVGVYHCIFWNRELQQNTTETFIIPDEADPLWSNRGGYIGTILAGVIVLIILLISAAVWSRSHGCRTISVSAHGATPLACCMFKTKAPHHAPIRFCDFCQSLYHNADKGILTAEPVDGAMPINRRELDVAFRSACSSETIGEVEADVHCEQSMVLEEV